MRPTSPAPMIRTRSTPLPGCAQAGQDHVAHDAGQAQQEDDQDARVDEDDAGVEQAAVEEDQDDHDHDGGGRRIEQAVQIVEERTALPHVVRAFAPVRQHQQHGQDGNHGQVDRVGDVVGRVDGAEQLEIVAQPVGDEERDVDQQDVGDQGHPRHPGAHVAGRNASPGPEPAFPARLAHGHPAGSSRASADSHPPAVGPAELRVSDTANTGAGFSGALAASRRHGRRGVMRSVPRGPRGRRRSVSTGRTRPGELGSPGAGRLPRAPRADRASQSTRSIALTRPSLSYGSTNMAASPATSGQRRYVRRNGGRPARHRLEHGQPESLEERGKDEQRRRPVPPGQFVVGHVAREEHVVDQAKLCHPGKEALVEPALAPGDDELGNGAAGSVRAIPRSRS